MLFLLGLNNGVDRDAPTFAVRHEKDLIVDDFTVVGVDVADENEPPLVPGILLA